MDNVAVVGSALLFFEDITMMNQCVGMMMMNKFSISTLMQSSPLALLTPKDLHELLRIYLN